MSAKVVKGQVLANFLVDHPCVDIKENLVNFVDLKAWKLFFDGSCHRKGVGVGIMIVSPNDEPTKFLFELDNQCSHNEAEYEALIIGLELLLEIGVKNVEVLRDS